MKFIEISEGTYIAVEAIESIVANEDGMTSTIKSGWNMYQSNLPCNILINLIEKKEDEPRKTEVLNILKTLGTFAG